MLRHMKRESTFGREGRQPFSLRSAVYITYTALPAGVDCSALLCDHRQQRLLYLRLIARRFYFVQQMRLLAWLSGYMGTRIEGRQRRTNEAYRT